MDLQRKETSDASLEENRRLEKRSPRGLEDVSYLFLSQPAEKPAVRAEIPDIRPAPGPSERAQIPFLLHGSPAASRELILGFLNTGAAVLEDGLRTIDAAIPCDPFGVIDLVAVDAQDQLCIIDVDIAPKDEALLRGIAFSDWIVRNTPIVRRMYQGRVINFSAHPRLFLVAPGFSPLLRCVAQRSTSPKVSCVSFRTVAMPGGVGVLFEHA